jgi:hypothetical protein
MSNFNETLSLLLKSFLAGIFIYYIKGKARARPFFVRESDGENNFVFAKSPGEFLK